MPIRLIKPDLPPLSAIAAPLEEILASGKLSNFGQYLKRFEAETASYLKTNTAAVSSATTGLILALSALGVPKGSKVVLPSFTFAATAQAVLWAGCMPVFADIEPMNPTISVEEVNLLLKSDPDIRAVIGVHTYGVPAAARPLEIAVEDASRRWGHKIALLFDAAHAFGSTYDGQRVGGFGDVEVFSLSATKILVSGEGGLVSSRNPALIGRVNDMSNYGLVRIGEHYETAFPGLNGKMSEFHALVGLYNLRRIDGLLKMRREKATIYRQKIEANTIFRMACWPPDSIRQTFKDFTIVMPEGALHQLSRDHVMKKLTAAGIESRCYFHPPLHRHAYFRSYATRPLPNTEFLSKRVINIPFFTAISHQEMDQVVDALQCAIAC